MARLRVTTRTVAAAMMTVLLLAALPAFTAPGEAKLPQGDASYCYVYGNNSGPGTYTVKGALTFCNNGVLPSSIGNVVINLQRPNDPEMGSDAQWVSVAADVADIISGDAAAAGVVAAARSEEETGANNAWGANNYSVFGALGIFVETSGSGNIAFRDALTGSPWSIMSEQTVAPGESITLLYEAAFNSAVLPPAGIPLRTEVLVNSAEDFRSMMNAFGGADGKNNDFGSPFGQGARGGDGIANGEGTGDIVEGDFTTYSQGGFGGSGTPYKTLAANFATLYPTGVEVGLPGASGYSMIFTAAEAVQDFLPAGGKAKALVADLIDPTKSTTGQFGGQVLALKLNVALSAASITPSGFGNLYFHDPSSSLDGQSVSQILAAAETALGGGILPTGYDYSSIASLCEKLDTSFDGGTMSTWAEEHLSKTP